MIRVKSTSNEGIYYLVNGWDKYKAFWIKEGSRFLTEYPNATLFKTKGYANRSLNRVKYLMYPDYENDIIEYLEVEDDYEKTK